ncbi:MAG: sulfotransferase domain-containing protein [Desulfobacteraceae bacterium]|nr:sulfotransferase domain-containing protein [Desulfobacteraceae bacterium]
MKYQQQVVEALLANTNIFFILSTGRSGTQFLSNLLSQIDDRTLVMHEPDFYYDIGVLEKSKNSKQYASDYINNFRKFSIYDRIDGNEVEGYGEVTGTLRFHSEALRGVFPNAKIMLMSRDGRDVIRSVMGWPEFYGKESKGAYNLTPQQDDKYFDKWHDMTRFEKLCWSWQNSNRSMLSLIQPNEIFQFEKIISSYEYFKTRVLDKLELNVSEQQWTDSVNRKSPNSTKQYDFPHWADWSESQKETFMSICGPIMEKLDYDLTEIC